MSADTTEPVLCPDCGLPWPGMMQWIPCVCGLSREDLEAAADFLDQQEEPRERSA